MNGNDHRPEPSDPHKVVKKDVGGHEFTAAFYPGFARSITVNGDSVYDQKADGPHPFVLPAGSEKPWSTSAVELTSAKGYRVVVHLDDPDHVIDHIELVLRDPSANGGGVVAHQTGGGGDLVKIANTPVICPPYC